MIRGVIGAIALAVGVGSCEHDPPRFCVISVDGYFRESFVRLTENIHIAHFDGNADGGRFVSNAVDQRLIENCWAARRANDECSISTKSCRTVSAHFSKGHDGDGDWKLGDIGCVRNLQLIGGGLPSIVNFNITDKRLPRLKNLNTRICDIDICSGLNHADLPSGNCLLARNFESCNDSHQSDGRVNTNPERPVCYSLLSKKVCVSRRARLFLRIILPVLCALLWLTSPLIYVFRETKLRFAIALGLSGLGATLYGLCLGFL